MAKPQWHIILANHPPGDQAYRNGYDTISFDAGAKNILSIGAVGDAVNGGCAFACKWNDDDIFVVGTD
jgi:hypothetical protein